MALLTPGGLGPVTFMRHGGIAGQGTFMTLKSVSRGCESCV